MFPKRLFARVQLSRLDRIVTYMMDAARIQKATILGAGTMGNGIAQVCAQAGMDSVLFDVSGEALARGLESIESMLQKAVEKGKKTSEQADTALGHIRPSSDLADAVNETDLVIEAVPEDLDLKKTVFAQIEEMVSPSTLLATNTSSLSIDAIGASLVSPERFLGMHFFNPVPVMALLEVVRGDKTGSQWLDLAVAIGVRLGKEPIVVRNSPGFASSRLGIAFAIEAIRMIEEEVASPEDIDQAMVLGYRHPMGPLRLTDLVGLDVRLGISEYLASTLGERFQPPALLRRMVEEGKLGQKSGEGFYRWDS